MSKIIVRTAVLTDAAQIHNFILELATYEKAAHEVKASVADIERMLFSSGCTAHALIAEKNNIAVGMGIYFFNYSTWLGKNGLYLLDLYVSTEHRSSGVGKTLLSRLAEIALENDCGRMEWTVIDWNKSAIDVYNALGAKSQDERIGYRLTGDALSKLASHSENIENKERS